MTTHITKTWFDGKNIVTQEIPESEIYKREWVELTDDDIDRVTDAQWARSHDKPIYAAHRAYARAIAAVIKEMNA